LIMKTTTRSFMMLASVVALLFASCACSDVFKEDDSNDNVKLFGTKWFSKEGDMGLEFTRGNKVFFILDAEDVGSGTFEYYTSTGIITFDAFNVVGRSGQELFEGRTIQIQITDAEVSGKSMKVYFHELSETEEYYMTLYKN